MFRTILAILFFLLHVALCALAIYYVASVLSSQISLTLFAFLGIGMVVLLVTVLLHIKHLFLTIKKQIKS